MKKNQERRLHRKNAKIVKEGGTPMQLNRPLKPDTTVRHAWRAGRDHEGWILTPITEALWPLWSDGSYEYVHHALCNFILQVEPC